MLTSVAQIAIAGRALSHVARRRIRARFVQPHPPEGTARLARSPPLPQGERDIGGAVVHGAPLALDEGEGGGRVEVLLQDDAPAVGHDGEQRVQAAEAPKERDPHPHAVAGPRCWRSPICHVFSMRPRCWSCTPFGVDVVPDV